MIPSSAEARRPVARVWGAGLQVCATTTSAVRLPRNNQGMATWQLPVPNDTAHLGLRFFNQGFVLDPGANQLGVIATNGGAGVIGAR